MDFRLEDGGLHFADGQDFFALFYIKVGLADGPDLDGGMLHRLGV